MKNHKVTKAKFHIGIMAGGRVYSSVDAKQGFEIEMWPMGLFIKGSGPHAAVLTVATYNNVIGFDVVESEPVAAAPPTPPAPAPVAAPKATPQTVGAKALKSAK